MMENLHANPCVGCGPENPRGLRLAFEETATGARTALVATRDLEGWPERLHSGVLYLALLETANWALFSRRERVGLPARTSGLDARAWVATGETLTLEAREAATSTPERPIVEATATRADGRLVARLEREYDLLTKDALVKRLGYEKLPAVLEGLVPDS